MLLTACGGCQRHVRDDEAECPFCGATIEAIEATVAPGPTGRPGRNGRLALMLAGAGLLLATTGGCIAAYGAPAPADAGPDTTAADAGPEQAEADAGPEVPAADPDAGP